MQSWRAASYLHDGNFRIVGSDSEKISIHVGGENVEQAKNIKIHGVVLSYSVPVRATPNEHSYAAQLRQELSCSRIVVCGSCRRMLSTPSACCLPSTWC